MIHWGLMRVTPCRSTSPSRSDRSIAVCFWRICLVSLLLLLPATARSDSWVDLGGEHRASGLRATTESSYAILLATVGDVRAEAVPDAPVEYRVPLLRIHHHHVEVLEGPPAFGSESIYYQTASMGYTAPEVGQQYVVFLQRDALPVAMFGTALYDWAPPYRARIVPSERRAVTEWPFLISSAWPALRDSILEFVEQSRPASMLATGAVVIDGDVIHLDVEKPDAPFGSLGTVAITVHRMYNSTNPQAGADTVRITILPLTNRDPRRARVPYFSIGERVVAFARSTSIGYVLMDGIRSVWHVEGDSATVYYDRDDKTTTATMPYPDLLDLLSK